MCADLHGVDVWMDVEQACVQQQLAIGAMAVRLKEPNDGFEGHGNPGNGKQAACADRTPPLQYAAAMGHAIKWSVQSYLV